MAFPLVDPQGGKEALLAEIADFTRWGATTRSGPRGRSASPLIYLNDWPDRYIHTNDDTVANIDATKLLRAAFLGAASALYLSGLDSAEVPSLYGVMRGHAMERTASMLQRARRRHA